MTKTREENNKKVFDDIVDDSEMFATLKDILSERGYMIIKEEELVKEIATQRIVTGNEARAAVRRIMKNILTRDIKEEKNENEKNQEASEK